MRRVTLNLRIALRSLLSFKIRTILAVLGVFLGTFSLVVVSNLSGSLIRKTALEVEKLGKNLLIVTSGQVVRHAKQVVFLSESANLTLSDARAIAAHSAYVQAVAPSSRQAFPVRYGKTVLASVLITGVTPKYMTVRNVFPQTGRFVSPKDERDSAKVAVLGSRVAEKLFGASGAIGKTVLIRRVPCRIIGVMEPKGADVTGVNRDLQVFVPLRTFLRLFVNRNYVGTIYVQAQEPAFLSLCRDDIARILRIRHGILAGKKDDFSIVTLKDVTALRTQAVDTVSILGSVSSGISFLIGGLGILSIMVLMVTERRTEIGIRRALGSRKRDIVMQFLLESSWIALFGGVAGVVCGLIASVVLFKWFSLPYRVSYSALLLAFFASGAVGILGGVYPSSKAVTVQPVDVIRN